jgi:hypothetical protein
MKPGTVEGWSSQKCSLAYWAKDCLPKIRSISIASVGGSRP